METFNKPNLIQIAHKGENEILTKVGDYFSLEINNLLIKYEDTFELEKKGRFGFYVKEKNTGHLYGVFASIEDEKLVDLTTTDLDYFEEVTQ